MSAMLRRLPAWVFLATWPALLAAAGDSRHAADCEFPDSVRHSRPGAGHAATEVRVGAYLIDISRIEDADQSYQADIFLRYDWKDERLAGARATSCTLPRDTVWHPDVLVVNRRSVQSQMNEVVEVQPDGSVRYVQRLIGDFAVRLKMKHFPFDTQQLPVTLVARYAPEQLKLLPDNELVGIAETLSTPNWKIGKPVLSSGSYAVLPGRDIARLEIVFPAERRSAYYVWKLIVPMSFVVFMSWAAFWISPQNIAPRIGLSATSMLTLIAFRLALGSSLPPIPYLTEFDVFTVGVTMLVFAALLQAVATSALWDGERKTQALRLNRVSRWLFPVVFAALLLVAFSGLVV